MLRPVESASAGVPLQTASPRSENLASGDDTPVTGPPDGAVPWQRSVTTHPGHSGTHRDLVDEWAAPPGVHTPSPGPGGALAFVGDGAGSPALWVREADGAERVVRTGPGQVRSVLWSPDGGWIAVVVAPGGGERTEVRLVRPDGSRVRRLAGGVTPGTDEPSAAIAVRWLAGGSLLLVTESVRSGLTHALTVDLAGHRRHLAAGLALQVCAVHEDAAGRWRLLLREGPRGARRILITSVPAAEPGPTEPGPTEPGPTEPGPTEPATSELATSELGAPEPATPELGAVDVPVLLPAEAVTAPFVVPGGTATAVSGAFSADGTRAFLASDLGRERQALLEVLPQADGTPGAARLLAGRDDADLERFVLLDPTTAVLCWNVDGRSELALFDLVTGVSRALPAPPREVVTWLLGDPTGTSLILALSGSTATGELWTLDLVPALDLGRDGAGDGVRAGAAVGVGGESAYRCLVSHTPTAYPTLELMAVDNPAAELARPAGMTELIRPLHRAFTARDGLALSGWWYRPAVPPGPVPTLLYFHGGPEAQERPVLNPLFQALLARGIAVFAPNVRGSAGFGRSFELADHLDRRFAGITDVADASAFLVGEGLAAPGRIGVAGRSYGGYLTLAALVGFPELFAAGVDICGMADLETFYQHTEPWIAAAAVTKYGDPATDRELLRALSPLHRMDALAAPLLVVHGANDTNVPLFEAEQTVDAARARGVPCEYLLFEGEGHEVAERGNRLVFVRAVVDFVAAHLTGEEAGEPLGEAV